MQTFEFCHKYGQPILPIFDKEVAEVGVVTVLQENPKSYMQRQWRLVGGMAGTFREIE